VILLLQDALKSEKLADKLGARIALKSDGVPFFVFEMIRGLKEGQFIAELPDGSWVETKVIDEIEVPSAVRDLVEARLKDLTKEERFLLDLGAVQGFEFDPELTACATQRPLIDVLQDLAGIQRRSGVVRSEGLSCRFDHHQIQEVVYEDLPGRLKQECHALVAEAFAARVGAESKDPGELPGEAAHFLALHHLKGSLPGESLPFLTPALEHLAKSCRNEAAIDLANLALGIGGLLGGEDRMEVLLRKAGRLNLLGRREEARPAFDVALALADETGEPLPRARARVSLSSLLLDVSCYDKAQEALLAAIDLAREAGDERQEARATVNLGSVFHNLGLYEEACEHIERSLATLRNIRDVDSQACATMNLGNVFEAFGQAEEAREQYEEGLRLAREAGNRRVEAQATVNLGTCFWSLGRSEEAREHHDSALALFREIGDRQGEAVGHMTLGYVYARLGDHHGAREHLEASRALCAAIDARRMEGYALHGLAALAMQEGLRKEAVRLYEEALALRRQISYKRGVAETQRCFGSFLAEEGRPEAARPRLEEALALGQEIENPNVVTLATCSLATLPDGDPDAALEALTEHESGVRHYDRQEARFLLWRATQDPVHLEESHRLLCHLRDHAPEEYRETMIENVPLHRDIVAAWAEHGADAV
jgi:tetratricopeptide (TPR) repeat protein